MKISVITPTYNRAKTLGRLYESIKKNINFGGKIQWLIMDDGSKDNTEQVVNGFIDENLFDIVYEKQKNQGKMKAINAIISRADGDFIIECDSDDFFTNNAFKAILEKCVLNDNIYAYAFLKYDQNECNIGNLFPNEGAETSMFDLYFKDEEKGEKALVFNAKIRKQFMYELEENEKFVTEARMYHKMDKNYYIKGFNIPIMICEYQKDGYTKNIKEIFKKNPQGFYKYFEKIFEMPFVEITFIKRLYIIKHYILFSILAKKSHPIKNVKGRYNKFLTILLWIPGYIKTKCTF